MLSRIRKLREAGIMGMNERNARYIMEFNPRRLYPLVDDKLRTKRLAMAAGINVPELYGVVEIQHQVAELPDILKDRHDFCDQAGAG